MDRRSQRLPGLRECGIGRLSGSHDRRRAPGRGARASSGGPRRGWRGQRECRSARTGLATGADRRWSRTRSLRSGELVARRRVRGWSSITEPAQSADRDLRELGPPSRRPAPSSARTWVARPRRPRRDRVRRHEGIRVLLATTHGHRPADPGDGANGGPAGARSGPAPDVRAVRRSTGDPPVVRVSSRAPAVAICRGSGAALVCERGCAAPRIAGQQESRSRRPRVFRSSRSVSRSPADWKCAAGMTRVNSSRASRLSAALLTFRPSDRAGQSRGVEPADLAPGALVRTVPRRCRPLTLLAIRTPLDGESWTGINGSPAQPVKTLTVRYADALQREPTWTELRRDADVPHRRAQLSAVRQPAQPSPSAIVRRPSVFGDRLEYALTPGQEVRLLRPPICQHVDLDLR